MLRLALASLLASAALATVTPTAQAYPDPILTTDRTGDPAVVETSNGRVMVATGPLLRRARWDPGEGWRWIKPALARLPRWAIDDGDVWAADLAQIDGRWVLYYAVRVAGLGKGGRCIGMATARTAYDRFRPVDARPLVCYPRARTPRAYDTVPNTPDLPGLPHRGVIDPSFFLDDDGTPYLLYKTDRLPSSIRLLPLGPRGLAPVAGATSSELVRASWVMENPVVLRRGDFYHLFTSEDIWSKCSYRTVWRRSTDLATWPVRPRRVLLNRTTTDGLCGPGGADLLMVDDQPLLYFHGWLRIDNDRPPDPPFVEGGRGPDARRVLYGARLRFTNDAPIVARYLTH